MQTCPTKAYTLADLKLMYVVIFISSVRVHLHAIILKMWLMYCMPVSVCAFALLVDNYVASQLLYMLIHVRFVLAKMVSEWKHYH